VTETRRSLLDLMKARPEAPPPAPPPAESDPHDGDAPAACRVRAWLLEEIGERYGREEVKRAPDGTSWREWFEGPGSTVRAMGEALRAVLPVPILWQKRVVDGRIAYVNVEENEGIVVDDDPSDIF